jgi:hypothetical protein
LADAVPIADLVTEPRKRAAVKVMGKRRDFPEIT